MQIVLCTLCNDAQIQFIIKGHKKRGKYINEEVVIYNRIQSQLKAIRNIVNKMNIMRMHNSI